MRITLLVNCGHCGLQHRLGQQPRYVLCHRDRNCGPWNPARPVRREGAAGIGSDPSGSFLRSDSFTLRRRSAALSIPIGALATAALKKREVAHACNSEKGMLLTIAGKDGGCSPQAPIMPSDQPQSALPWTSAAYARTGCPRQPGPKQPASARGQAVPAH